MRSSIVNEFKKVQHILPGNTLDQLISDLGGVDCVAEMTGRKTRVVRTSDETGVVIESRAKGKDQTLNDINIQEKNYFMNGDKLIAIISDAASTGISLHADKRAKNKRPRIHM